MNILTKIQDLARIEFNWLMDSRISLSERLAFFIKKYYSIFRKRRQIIFRNKIFKYDNLFTPVLLEEYPKEILFYDKIVNFKKSARVLDIGANVGQFGATLKSFFPHLFLYSFEPNSNIFKLLQSNSKEYKNWHVYNFGIDSKKNIIDFFYIKNKSGQGSAHIENSNKNLNGKTSKIKVEVYPLNSQILSHNKLPRYFDFVKIDVEGYEKNVLNGLQDIDFMFMYIEMSSQKRGGINVKEVKEIIKKNLKFDLKVVYKGKRKRGELSTQDVIFKKDIKPV